MRVTNIPTIMNILITMDRKMMVMNTMNILIATVIIHMTFLRMEIQTAP